MNIAEISKRRYLRIHLIVLVYSLVLIGSLLLAYLLRFEFAIPAEQWALIPRQILWIVPAQLAILLLIGQFAGLLSYFSIPDLRRLFYGLTFPFCAFLIIWNCGFAPQLPPRSILVADFLLAFGGLSASRLFFRLGRERYFTRQGKPSPRRARRVGIFGGGDAGAALICELISKPGLGMQPVAIFDDDRHKWQSSVHNIPVVGAPEILAERRSNLRLDEIVIAMPSASGKRIREIVKFLGELKIKFTTVPSREQLATGKVSVSHLRPVDIQDLLGRESVHLERENIAHYLMNQAVMVTGAGGSIGSELCRQIALFRPRCLILVDQSEVQLFEIEQQLIELGHAALIQPMVGDVTDRARMDQIFRQTRPEVIFHAAAHKHVPMMESQPGEAIKNNTLGTSQLAELSLQHEVKRFVMISTDKAINPTSVMGVTKRLAELVVQALQGSRPNGTRFMAVRFGNVLGSSGSVIPTFKRQIAAGGPIKITHPQMTRYFMTIPEAVSLVLQSGALGQGGEIFVLDMGKPVKILDLARQLIELSGCNPEEIEIQYIGLRPGEKLFEELQHGDENLAPTHHPKILRFIAEPLPLNRILAHLETLKAGLHQLEPGQLKLLMKQAVPEYRPHIAKTGGRSRKTAHGSSHSKTAEAKPAEVTQASEPQVLELAGKTSAVQPVGILS